MREQVGMIILGIIIMLVGINLHSYLSSLLGFFLFCAGGLDLLTRDI